MSWLTIKYEGGNTMAEGADYDIDDEFWDDELPQDELPEEEVPSLEEGLEGIDEEFEGIEDGEIPKKDGFVRKFFRGLGNAADAATKEVWEANRNIVLQLGKDVLKGGDILVREVGGYKLDKDYYFEKKQEQFDTGLKGIRARLQQKAKNLGEGVAKAVGNTRDSIVGTGKKVGDGFKEAGESIKEKGPGGLAMDATKKVSEGIESKVSRVVEAKLASPSQLYIPGFAGQIGERLGEPIYETQALSVYELVTALADDYSVLPEDLGLGAKNQKTRKGILEDFILYGTTDTDYLLMHLRLRRGEFSSDPDPTLTKNEISILEGEIGDALKEARATYMKTEEEDE